MAIIYFFQEFFFDGSIYLSTSGSYNKVAIFPAIYLTRPSSPGASLNSMTSSLSSLVALSGYCAPLSIASVVYSELSSGFNICIRASLFTCYIVPQIPSTVNLRRLFSFIRHKIKIVIIFSVCRMVYTIYFLPCVHIYLWEKSVSIGKLGINLCGVNSVNFWNV